MDDIIQVEIGLSPTVVVGLLMAQYITLVNHPTPEQIEEMSAGMLKIIMHIGREYDINVIDIPGNMDRAKQFLEIVNEQPEIHTQ